MRANHILALLAALTLTACATPEPGFFEREMSQAPPAAAAIETLDSIPTDELSTSGTTALDETNPCAGIPPEVVSPVGFPDPPVAEQQPGCVWWSEEHLVLSVTSFMASSMAEAVSYHERTAAEQTLDRLTHLEWLRIDGNYAIERILATDSASTCTLILDVGSSAAIEIQLYRVNPDSQDAIAMEPRKAFEAFCPVGRQVARNLLRHFGLS